MITLTGGYLINREYTDDTLKNILTVPVSFHRFLWGKLLTSGILAVGFGIYSFFAGIQDKLAILPDYGFKSSDTIAGTSFSGIVGGVVVILLCIVCCNLFKFFRKKA